MTAIRTMVAGAAVALAMAPAAAADKAADAKKPGAPPMAMEMPKPGPEMDALKGMVGNWDVVSKHEPSPWGPGGEGKGSETVLMGPGGFSVVMDYRETMAGMEFIGHGAISWNADLSAYQLVWLDSMAPGASVSLGKKDGNSFVFTGEEKMMGKKIHTRMTMTTESPTAHTFTMEMGDSPTTLKVMGTSKYTKRP